MDTAQSPEAHSDTRSFDAVIIGAGLSGMQQLYQLRKLGLSARIIEASDDVGGTWNLSRYPGLRLDSESYTYAYAFDDELLQTWDWTERFVGQEELWRYFRFAAEKLDLRRDIQFNTRVNAARYDEAAKRWRIATSDGAELDARYLIACSGPLVGAPQMPKIDGIESFKGEAYHTAEWPRDHKVSFEGKRVAVIGTGATGVQVIQEVSKTAGHLTVFQRTPNWCAPLGNGPLSQAEMDAIKANYKERIASWKNSFAQFEHQFDPRSVFDVSEEEREALFEQRYYEPGFAIFLSVFADCLVDPRANAVLTDFAARKIRQRVNDPVTAAKLTPTNHGFGSRRLPLETNYYEVYNQPNVSLVDCSETPIEAVTPVGIRTSAGEQAFDMIVFATGFDAIVGPLNRIDISGIGGRKLKDKWADGPVSLFGIHSHGFPNLLIVAGPNSSATLCNVPRCVEDILEWTTGLIAHAERSGAESFDVSAEAETAWTDRVLAFGEMTLASKVDSWFTGVNSNIEGRQKRRFMLYPAGAVAYRGELEGSAAAGYPELEFA